MKSNLLRWNDWLPWPQCISGGSEKETTRTHTHSQKQTNKLGIFFRGYQRLTNPEGSWSSQDAWWKLSFDGGWGPCVRKMSGGSRSLLLRVFSDGESEIWCVWDYSVWCFELGVSSFFDPSDKDSHRKGSWSRSWCGWGPSACGQWDWEGLPETCKIKPKLFSLRKLFSMARKWGIRQQAHINMPSTVGGTEVNPIVNAIQLWLRMVYTKHSWFGSQITLDYPIWPLWRSGVCLNM